MKNEKSSYLKNLEVDKFLERPDVETFVGKNFPRFKHVWLSDYAKTKRADKFMVRFHWNLMAFFLPMTWFAYRKMAPMFIALTAILCAAILLESFALYRWNVSVPPQAYLGVWVWLCFASKSFYFFHVADFFRKREAMPAPELETNIKKFGGVSVPFAIAGTIGYFAALTAAAYLGDFIWPTSMENGIEYDYAIIEQE